MNDQLVEYISKLINRCINERTEISLSSAQRARVHAWLTINSIMIDDRILSKKFTIIDLLRSTPNDYSQQERCTPSINLQPPPIDGTLSLGIDIQRVDELFPNGLSNDPKSDAELTIVFTLHELSYAQLQDNPLQTLTGIFCIKEAVKKCSRENLKFLDVEISHGMSGAPMVFGYIVSVSHSGNYAIAVAMPDSSKIIKAATQLSASSRSSLSEPTHNDFLVSKFRMIDLISLLLIVVSIFIGIFK